MQFSVHLFDVKDNAWSKEICIFVSRKYQVDKVVILVPFLCYHDFYGCSLTSMNLFIAHIDQVCKKISESRGTYSVIPMKITYIGIVFLLFTDNWWSKTIHHLADLRWKRPNDLSHVGKKRSVAYILPLCSNVARASIEEQRNSCKC